MIFPPSLLFTISPERPPEKGPSGIRTQYLPLRRRDALSIRPHGFGCCCTGLPLVGFTETHRRSMFIGILGNYGIMGNYGKIRGVTGHHEGHMEKLLELHGLTRIACIMLTFLLGNCGQLKFWRIPVSDTKRAGGLQRTGPL